MHEILGIIAGSGSLPLELAREARAQGIKRLIAVGFTNETNRDLEQFVDAMHWIRVGQLSKLIAAFKDDGVRHCVMAGQVAPKSIFDVRPDLRGLALLLRVKEKNAHTVFGAIADELRKDGIELIEGTPWLKPLMPGKGFHLGPKLSAEQSEDVAFGYRIAKEVTRLEIGQLVIVKDGIVLAVEAFEGTDACLARGGTLAGKDGGAIAVKVAREKHDMRFDIPCIGSRTIQTCADAGVSVFAFEAEKTLLLDRAELESLAKRHRITLLSC